MGPPSGKIPKGKETELIEGRVNEELGSPIYVYDERPNGCMIGESEECHEEFRFRDLADFHLGK